MNHVPALKDLIESGVHFGNRTARWDPKMKPYIHAKRNGIHIIDLRETLRGLIRAMHFLKQTVQRGGKVLVVGTKRQAGEVVRQQAKRGGCFFIANRWLGGTLTNMDTMRRRISRLEQLDSLIETGEIHNFSKKMTASLTREQKKIHRNFEGIRAMSKKPAAMIIIDPNSEAIAIKEAAKADIPIIGILDTDCDPDPIDFIIPGNDDSLRSVQILLGALMDAVLEGKGQPVMAPAEVASAAPTAAAEEAEEEDGGVEVPEDIGSVGSFSMGGDDE